MTCPATVTKDPGVPRCVALKAFLAWRIAPTAPTPAPHLTPEPVVARILEVRRHRGRGHPNPAHPARRMREAPRSTLSTVCCAATTSSLKKPRRKHTHPSRPSPRWIPRTQPGRLTTKGEFRTGRRGLCYPLTVQDGHSRFRLECPAMERLDIIRTRAVPRGSEGRDRSIPIADRSHPSG
jgi:hypothetical protein